MATKYLSAQLGTAQLGLDQLGQFKKLGGAAPGTIDGSGQAPLPVTATALHAGGAVSGGVPPIVISGAARSPLPVTSTALFAGGAISGGIPAVKRGRGSFWPWMPGELALRMLDHYLEGGEENGST